MVARLISLGASLDRDIKIREYGHIANMADPFGNGFDLIEFTGPGYDAVSRQGRHPSSSTSTASLALSNTGSCVRAEISGSRDLRAPDNLLYLVDNDPMELCDLCPRHPVPR